MSSYYFDIAVPVQDGRVNLLQRPSSFPLPEVQYTLKEMTVIWHLYGGRDFVLPSSAGKKPGHGSRNRGGTVDKKAGLPSTAAWRQSRARLGNRYGLDLRGSLWKVGGGPDRDHSVLVEVELDKVRNSRPRWVLMLVLMYLVKNVD